LHRHHDDAESSISIASQFVGHLRVNIIKASLHPKKHAGIAKLYPQPRHLKWMSSKTQSGETLFTRSHEDTILGYTWQFGFTK
jgi:hypothetical protein